MGENGILDFDTGKFLDDPLTPDVNETETLGVQVLTAGPNEESTKGYLYTIYKEKVYRIIFDLETYKSEAPLEIVYEPKGNEVKDLGEVTGNTEYNGWTVLYDDGETMEAVSPTAMGELRLGYTEGTTDSEVQLAEAIESYNNAIDTINTYCQSLEGLPTNIGVRSVGASTDTTTEMYNGIPADWTTSIYNGVGKVGDTEYEQDLVRMAYHGVAGTGTEYWMTSRVVSLDYQDVSVMYFEVCSVYVDGFLNYINMWRVLEDGSAFGYDHSCSVRPIITIQNP